MELSHRPEMAHRLEDLHLDEGYWRALLEEVEHLPIPPTQTNRSPAAPTYNGAVSGTPSQARAWDTVRSALREGAPVEVEGIGFNRGGLVVACSTLRGFIPTSHLVALTPEMNERDRRAVLASYVGRRFQAFVIEAEPQQQRLLLSEREPRSETRLAEVPPLLRSIQPGEIREGVVTNLTSFGAFVDLGGYEGLVHISELSWSRVGHPRDVLSVGQTVCVYVMSVSPEEGRVALSIKRTRPNPWEGLEQRYHVGQLVQGVVTNVVEFGAFVKVEEELEGLVHVGELAEGEFMHPRNVVREGDQVVARVIAVDGAARRLALSLRGVPQS
ncbi:MAG: S1 RNA-binding domain-containing protein [Thermoflexales bacterium]|nr:S1 RNA-binding domain-containing protein [Thermoflexales bacterium]